MKQRAPRSYHHGNLREEVLRQAEKTLKKTGYRHLSLREVSKELGVSHAAPRRHFGDKDALLDALACQGYERLRATMAAAAKESTSSFETRLIEFGRIYVRFATANAALLEMMLSRKHGDKVSPELKKAAQDFYMLPIEWVARAQLEGHLVPGDSVHVAIPLFAAIQGLVVLCNKGQIGGRPVEALVPEVVNHILTGLRPL